MGHFRSNLRDLEFTLFEVLRVQDRMGSAPFDELEMDTARDLLGELNRVATGPLAAGFADADRHPPVFDPSTGSVTLPDSLRQAYRVLWDGEWWRLGLPAELGGYGVPPTVQWAAAELMLGANPAAFLYLAGPSFAAVVHRRGTAEQRRWAELMIERGWGATMVLTEPDAGSDVGAGRTRAVRQADGRWHLEGVKRFITSAEHDLTENIVHLVLARPEGPDLTPAPGTKGLSLFLVPKWHFDPVTGELGERNGVFVTNVEHKMGLKASTTCELTFGATGVPAVGWLLGEVHDGIAQMFDVIEHARMLVGTKAIGTLSTGYLTALDYAKQRVQGADLTRMADKAAPRVTIINHPDVRRMLMLQKAYTEGLRALYLYAASFSDQVQVGRAAGDDVAEAAAVNDLLLPVVKGVGSERATEMLQLSLQTLGGSGYLQDYPIEQYLRDAKIDSLYEGTTAIQSLDLLVRKIVRDRGRALGRVVGEIRAFLDAPDAAGGTGHDRLKAERVLLDTALADVQAMLGTLTRFVSASAEHPACVYKAGQHSVRLLLAVGDLLVGWLLLRQAEVALTALDGPVRVQDHGFYQGKVGAARFFASTVLPRLSADRAIVEAADNALMDLPADAF
jgi:alkylation response protein AidB-like acyl-CoA dehydrogenase